MKVVKQAQDFRPVVITLESKDEVDALCAVVGSIVGEGSFRDTSIRSVTNKLYDGLKDCGASPVASAVDTEMELGH